MSNGPTTIVQPDEFKGINGIPYNIVGDLAFDEDASTTAITDKVLEIRTPLQLARRKIYAWLFASPSVSSDYFVDCRVNFWQGTSATGSLPLRLGISNGTVNTVVSSTLVSCFTTQGQTNADSIGIYVGKPAAGEPPSLSLQPLYLFGKFDRVTLSCKEMKNVNYFRCFLAVISSQ